MSEGTGSAQVADHFRKKIRSGELPPGTKLPTVRETAAEFGVAMDTANRAYKALRAEGLTESRGTLGTFVAAPGSAGIEDRVRTHAATGKALAKNETSRILEIATVQADQVVAGRLDVEPGTPVHVRRRVVSRDGVPVHMSSSYYPPYVIEAVPELLEPVSTGGSRELAAERLGSTQDRELSEVTSRYATDPEKDALSLNGSSVIVTQVVRTVYLDDGRVVEVAVKVTGGSTTLKWSTPLG